MYPWPRRLWIETMSPFLMPRAWASAGFMRTKPGSSASSASVLQLPVIERQL
mgnify:CR=1 FL=1